MACFTLLRAMPTAFAVCGSALAAGSPVSPGADPEAAQFAHCAGPGRVTCVVDGDTIWYRGTKIRLADINAPEVSQPACAAEAALAARATRRLTELLNAGPFSLAREGRDVDRYGRLLRVVTRRGASLGGTLESEGLAEHWQGKRGSWC
jgi:micrococcal nuclease